MGCPALPLLYLGWPSPCKYLIYSRIYLFVILQPRFLCDLPFYTYLRKYVRCIRGIYVYKNLIYGPDQTFSYAHIVSLSQLRRHSKRVWRNRGACGDRYEANTALTRIAISNIATKANTHAHARKHTHTRTYEHIYTRTHMCMARSFPLTPLSHICKMPFWHLLVCVCLLDWKCSMYVLGFS